MIGLGWIAMPALSGRRRVVVERLAPEIDAGRFPIKRTVGESVDVVAWIHADGHDTLAAVLRHRPVPAEGERGEWTETPMRPLGSDEWTAGFAIEQACAYEYTVHAWIDRFGSWRHGLEAKLTAGQDVTAELLEGAQLLREAASRARRAGARHEAGWLNTQAEGLAAPAPAPDRARTALDPWLAASASHFPDRRDAAAYARTLVVSVDRVRARVGAWYEMFPRSWGPDPTRSATFREAAQHLPRIAAMGFDVVYLPPIHPIGKTFRKGRGNALLASPGDPGSPWAIGAEAGGHTAVEPGLGTLEDFDAFLAEARGLQLEVALDLAFQCSPDHPYVREHPEWFRHRPDGTIKYAENPPKKYQDIYPFDFECDAWRSLWDELKSVVAFWAARGVRLFRVDNPHTKPYGFWEWLIREIRSGYPDVVFLAEAFARPKVMNYLAKLGFNQSYTYFTWRTTSTELTEYLTELTQGDVAEFFRPNFFANTPDILHAYLQDGGPPAFAVRLILASMLGPSYGIYSGFELCEGRAVPGTEEYLDSEKYQYRHWDVERSGHLTGLVTTVNRIRRDHPALQSNAGLTFCRTDNPSLLAFCKATSEGSDAILVVVNLDPAHMQHGWVDVPVDRLGLPEDRYDVVDLLDGERYSWRGARNYVRLDPGVRVAHVLQLPASGGEHFAGGLVGTSLQRQRWFAGKARQVAAVRTIDSAVPRAGEVCPAITSVEYTEGGDERYFTPLTVAADGSLVDALVDDEACRALATILLDGRLVPMRFGVARATVHARLPVPAALPIVRASAEQSNSCVRLGDRYLLKVIRRLETGPHPELELLHFLTRQGFASMPRLVASLEYQRAASEDTTLALVQTFVANDGTAWDHAAADARAFAGREDTGGEGPGFVEAATALGRTTADLHAALAADSTDRSFAPEPFTRADAARLAERMQAGAARVLATLAERCDSLPEPGRRAARALLDARAVLDRRVADCATAPAGAKRTRVHGDYHLGQILTAGRRFVIVDFEGEPTRPLDERRAKQSPLKDVAGMLRSFGYAAQIALTAGAGNADASRMQAWESAVSAAFVTAYRQALAGAGLVPPGTRAFERMLGAFVLDKAIYEVEYELASRPEWVAIPLGCILRLLGTASPP
jgi:starch synthase (maltosyl-transferring)